MNKRKNKGLAVLFSFIPGAGHMYMGFMKMGVSLMAVFFAVIALTFYLDFGGLALLLPIIWFYGFFDAINKSYAPDEEFAGLEDKFLFSLDKLVSDPNSIFVKGRLALGIACILVGLNLLYWRLLDMFRGVILDEVYNILQRLGNIMPRLIVGGGIIIVGIALIIGKSREVKNNAEGS